MAETGESKTDSKQLVKISKIVTAATWVAATASFYPPFYSWPAGGLLRALFGILAVAHLIEFIIYLRFFRQVGGSMLGHFASTMAYGVIYYTEVKRRHASAGDP